MESQIRPPKNATGLENEVGTRRRLRYVYKFRPRQVLRVRYVVCLQCDKKKVRNVHFGDVQGLRSEETVGPCGFVFVADLDDTVTYCSLVSVFTKASSC